MAMAGKAVATHFVKLSESEFNELRGLCQRLDVEVDGIRDRNRERLLALDDDDNSQRYCTCPQRCSRKRCGSKSGPTQGGAARSDGPRYRDPFPHRAQDR